MFHTSATKGGVDGFRKARGTSSRENTHRFDRGDDINCQGGSPFQQLHRGCLVNPRPSMSLAKGRVQVVLIFTVQLLDPEHVFSVDGFHDLRLDLGREARGSEEEAPNSARPSEYGSILRFFFVMNIFWMPEASLCHRTYRFTSRYYLSSCWWMSSTTFYSSFGDPVPISQNKRILIGKMVLGTHTTPSDSLGKTNL